MKKYFIFIFLFMILTTTVYAEDKNLYSELKKNALDDGKESTYVTGTNGIDFMNPSSETNGRGIYYIHNTKNNTYPIIYYRGNISNNFAIYAGYCWQILLSTDTGAIKLLYAGLPDNNKCLAEEGAMSLNKVAFGLSNDNKYGPYMYTEDGTTYNDSVLKETIDNWFENNLTNKINEIEDVIYCNDRTPDDTYQFAARNRLLNSGPTLSCPKEYSYTVDSALGNGRLKYPVATVTADELTYNGLKLKDTTSDSFIWINFSYWAITPYSYNKNMYPNTKHALNENTFAYQAGARPVIAVNNTAMFRTGNGERNTPYILGVTPIYKIIKGNDYVILNNNNSAAGKTVTFTVQNREGLTIKDIIFTDEDGNNLNISYTKNGDNYQFEMPNKNVVITPNYRELKPFHLLTTSKTFITIPNNSIEEEQEALFNINIPHGYKLLNITFSDGNNNLDINYEEDNNTYRFIMPSTNVEIDVQFEELPKYKIISDNIDITNNEYYEGDKVVFRVKKILGKEIDKIIIIDSTGKEVDVNLTSKDDEYSFIMLDKDLTINVIYKNFINPKTFNNIYFILKLFIITIVFITSINLFNKYKKGKDD